MSSGRDLPFMRMALRLAAQPRAEPLPNPRVGAVVVRSGRVVGRGTHRKTGGPHAEVLALAQAGSAARGSTLYLTLEPCSHTGRTPPCTEAILKSGIRRVVAAMVDPNPRVRGRGMRRLRARGIRTAVGILDPEARALNEIFITRVSKQRPFVTVKLAQSLDGKIATAAGRCAAARGPRRFASRNEAAGGRDRWISGPAARRWAHRLRARNDALLVGVRTVLADDPQLTVRSGPNRRGPVRVVLDSMLRTPPNARLFASKSPVWIAATPRASRQKELRLRRAGAEILRLPAERGRVSFRALLKALARREISRLLIEGGGEVVASALEARAVDRAVWIIAPKILGGKEAIPAVGGKGARSPNHAVRLEETHVRRVGEDWILEGKVRFP